MLTSVISFLDLKKEIKSAVFFITKTVNSEENANEDTMDTATSDHHAENSIGYCRDYADLHSGNSRDCGTTDPQANGKQNAAKEGNVEEKGEH